MFINSLNDWHKTDFKILNTLNSDLSNADDRYLAPFVRTFTINSVAPKTRERPVRAAQEWTGIVLQ